MDGIVSSSNIVTRAAELDGKIQALMRRMPRDWLPATTHRKNFSQRNFNGHVDIYPDHFKTQTWNVLRCTRIMLHDMICSQRTEKDSSRHQTFYYPHQRLMSTLTIDRLAKEICASIPQWTEPECHPRTNKDINVGQMLQCYKVLWPLYVAGKYATLATKIKPWAISQFRYLSAEMGMRKAKDVGDILETAPETDPWSVYALLGSYAFAA